MAAATVKLRDGSMVDRALVRTTYDKLTLLNDIKPEALRDLATRCKTNVLTLLNDATLKEHRFIDSKGIIDPNVKIIIQNAFVDMAADDLVLQSPIHPDRCTCIIL